MDISRRIKMTIEEDEFKLRRAVSIHETNRKIIQKTEEIDKEVKLLIKKYLKQKYRSKGVIIDDSFIRIWMPKNSSLNSVNFREIEESTGTTFFKKMEINNGYIFKKNKIELPYKKMKEIKEDVINFIERDVEWI